MITYSAIRLHGRCLLSPEVYPKDSSLALQSALVPNRMPREIVICYRKIIDAATKGQWEQLVWQAAYDEYLLQVQYFDNEGRHHRYADLLQAVPAAEKLPFLVSGAIYGYLQQLHGKIPDIVNNIGKYFMQFSQYEFEILRADRDKPASFRIAISFYSDALVWLDTIGDYLLLKNRKDKTGSTHLFALRPYVNIHMLNEIVDES